MADIAASVLARLKNKAVETGRSNQLCLQLFCQEEFLRRLQRSQYAENLILKGGLFVFALTDFDSRVTVDVDFLLKNIPNTPEKLKPVLEDIIAAETGNDFITFEIIKIEPIPAKLATSTEQLAAVKTQMETAKGEVEKPFPQEKELTEKTKRLNEINIALNLDEKDHELIDAAPDESDGADQPERKSKEMAR